MKTIKQLHDEEQVEAKFEAHIKELEREHRQRLAAIKRTEFVFKAILLIAVANTVVVLIYGLWRAAQ